MATITFDTYEFMQTLKESGIPEKQAKAIVEGIKRIDLGHVSSKEDISALKQEMLEMKVTLIQWMVSLVFVQASLIVAAIKLLH